MRRTKPKHRAACKLRCITMSREGLHWDDNKGGWLDPMMCAKARREEVEYIRRHKMYTRVPEEVCLRESGRAPTKTGWAETDKGTTRKAHTREVGHEGVQDACEARAVCVGAATRGAESCAVGDRHGHWSTCEERASTLQHEEEYSSDCRQKITRQVTNTCAGCCNSACTAHATPHIGRRSLTQRSMANISWQPCTGTTSRSVENDRWWNSSSGRKRRRL